MSEKKAVPSKEQKHYPVEFGPSDARRLECACGNPDPAHADAMNAPLSSKEQLSRRWAVTLWRSLERLHLAVKDCARIGFEESSPTTNAHHADVWNALNDAQKDAALKLEAFSKSSGVETPDEPTRLLAAERELTARLMGELDWSRSEIERLKRASEETGAG